MSELILGCQAQIALETPPFSFNGLSPTRGRQEKPMKIFIYGCNGIGKTTFAAEFEKSILIDLERNAHHLEIDRYSLSNYQDVDDFLLSLKKESHPYKTIIIDFVDVLEHLIKASILKKANKEKLDDLGGYGAGYKQWEADFKKILCRIASLNKSSMNVVFLGHEKITEIKEPGESMSDCVTPAIQESHYSLICNWCFAVFYATSKVQRAAAEDLGFDKKRTDNVLKNNARIFYTQPSAAYLAKNVFKLHHTFPMDYPEFKEAINNFYNPLTTKKEN